MKPANKSMLLRSFNSYYTKEQSLNFDPFSIPNFKCPGDITHKTSPFSHEKQAAGIGLINFGPCTHNYHHLPTSLLLPLYKALNPHLFNLKVTALTHTHTFPNKAQSVYIKLGK